jgi:hypothetical protein
MTLNTPSEPNSAIETFCEAAKLNLDDPLRKGSLIELPNYGQLVATGDMHGHRRNFAKLVKYCALATSPARFVLLQELIHEEPAGLNQPDMSHELLLEAARWKCEFPDQVFFLQSNHEVSQLTGRRIVKDGRGVLRDFVAGVEATYGQAAPEVIKAIYGFIESFPLAARTRHRVFLSHSLPTEREMDGFDPTILDRRPTREDLADGPAGKLLWGRRHSSSQLDRLAEILQADLFIVGHQPEPMGFRVADKRLLILSSDHNHGVFLPIDLSKPVTMDDLVRNIRKFVSVA